MNEFEFDEKIEISNFIGYLDSSIGKYKFTNADGKRIFADVNGYLIGATYARKIEPKVMIVLYGEGSRAQTRQIPQSLADKILAREV
jgi:hypothetical protein